MFYNNGPKTMSFSYFFSLGILQYTYSPLPKIVKVSLKHINQTNVVETHFYGQNSVLHCSIKCHYEKFYSIGQKLSIFIYYFYLGIPQYTHRPLPERVEVSPQHINPTNVLETGFNRHISLIHCSQNYRCKKFYNTGQKLCLFHYYSSLGILQYT